MRFFVHIAIGSATGLVLGFLIGLVINAIMHGDAMSVAWSGGGYNADEMNRYKLIQALSCLISINVGAIIGSIYHLSAASKAAQHADPADRASRRH